MSSFSAPYVLMYFKYISWAYLLHSFSFALKNCTENRLGNALTDCSAVIHAWPNSENTFIHVSMWDINKHNHIYLHLKNDLNCPRHVMNHDREGSVPYQV